MRFSHFLGTMILLAGLCGTASSSQARDTDHYQALKQFSQVLDLIEIRTINQQHPIDQTTILLNKQQDLVIEAEDVLWLNGIYGLQLLSDNAVIGELQWRFERFGVERTEHRLII
mgnify:CR=1 FL=1